jgi:hypothetical protein
LYAAPNPLPPPLYDQFTVNLSLSPSARSSGREPTYTRKRSFEKHLRGHGPRYCWLTDMWDGEGKNSLASSVLHSSGSHSAVETVKVSPMGPAFEIRGVALGQCRSMSGYRVAEKCGLGSEGRCYRSWCFFWCLVIYALLASRLLAGEKWAANGEVPKWLGQIFIIILSVIITGMLDKKCPGLN